MNIATLFRHFVSTHEHVSMHARFIPVGTGCRNEERRSTAAFPGR